MPNERLEEKDARYRKLVKRLETAYRELAAEDVRTITYDAPERLMSETVRMLRQDISKIKEELLNIIDFVDTSIFAEHAALRRIRNVLIVASALTTISESAAIAYGMRDMHSMFNIIELPDLMQRALLVVVPIIYFVQLLGINRKYTIPSIESALEIVHFKGVTGKHLHKWPSLSSQKEVLAFLLYALPFLISVVVASINAFFFMQLVPKTYGFEIDEFWIVSTIMAACCGLDTIINEATETTIVIRKLFVTKNDHSNPNTKPRKLSQGIALTSGIVGALSEITENTTTVLVTLSVSSMYSRYAALLGVSLGVGCPNAIFKGGISRDACEAGYELLKQKAVLKQPKKVLVALETLTFSLLLGEALRNLFLRIMEENSLPFEVPQPLIHTLAVLIALRGAGNAMYCSYPFFLSLTNGALNGLIKGGQSIRDGIEKIGHCGATFFATPAEQRPLLDKVTNASRTEENNVSIQIST